MNHWIDWERWIREWRDRLFELDDKLFELEDKLTEWWARVASAGQKTLRDSA